jgi:hypothetical protein
MIMLARSIKVDPHRNTIQVAEGDFEIYREADRYMVGRVPDGQLLGYFHVELTDKGRVLARGERGGGCAFLNPDP